MNENEKVLVAAPTDRRVKAIEKNEGFGTRMLRSLRLSMSSVESKESVRSRTMPSADPNLGLTEDERENMDSKQMGTHYQNTHVGEANRQELSNEPLSHSFAQRINDEDRVKADQTYRKQDLMIKRKRCACKYCTIFLVIFLLAGLGAGAYFVLTYFVLEELE